MATIDTVVKNTGLIHEANKVKLDTLYTIGGLIGYTPFDLYNDRNGNGEAAGYQQKDDKTYKETV